MKKYYIGLVVLFIGVAGLFGYTLYQANLAKKDKAVSSKVQDIAEKLNSYVANKNKIPANLSEAGVKDAPSAVKYTRVSDERYTFCVTYQASSRGYGVGGTEMMTAALLSRFYGGANYGYGTSDYEDSQLYIYDFGGHNKGETCYKVKPSLSAVFKYDNQYCDPSYEFYSYTKEYCGDSSSSLDLMQN